MDKTITFFIDTSDKKKIIEVARKQGLGMSPFCRFVILKYLEKLQKDETRRSNQIQEQTY